MQCPEFQVRWNERLDQRSDPAFDPELCAHAEKCPPCRQLLAGERLVTTALRRAAVPALPDHFAAQVVRAAARSHLTASRRPQLLLLAAGTLLASAAAALLMVSFYWLTRGAEGQWAMPKTVPPGRPERPGPTSPAPFRSDPRNSLAFTQSNLLLAMPHLGDHMLEGIDGVAAAFPETVERLDQAARLSPGIRPLRLTFALLWDTLLRAVPSVRGDPPPASRPTGAGLSFADSVGLV